MLKLEDLVNKNLNKIYKKIKYLTYCSLIPLTIAMFDGCKKESSPISSTPKPPVVQNRLPETWITKPNNNQVFNTIPIYFEWGGSDPDGRVVGYRLLINQGQNYRTNTSEWINFAPGNYTISIAAQDDKGDYDPTPATVNVTYQPSNIISSGNVQKGKTDNNGAVTFREGSNNVIINVTDSQNRSIADVDVVYVDGINYETFIVTDQNERYLPSFNNFEHNSGHTIKLTSATTYSFSKKDYTSSSISSKTSLENFVKNEVVKDQNGCNSNAYQRTVSGEEYYNYLKTGSWINMVFSKLIGAVGESIVVLESLRNTTDKMGKMLGTSEEQYIKSRNWDMYILFDPDNKITTTLYLDIESNAPTVSISSLSGNKSDVTFSWIGSDAKDYNTITKFKDLTVCKGPTQSHDLTYEPRIFYSSGALYKKWTTTSGIETVYGIPDGDYKFEVAVVDEVGNKGVSPQRSFSIFTSNQQQTITLQPGSEGKDTYISIITLPGRFTFDADKNFGNEEYLSIHSRKETNGVEYYTTSFLYFDITQVPQSSTINSATLQVYGDPTSNYYATSSLSVKCKEVLDNWEESTITWNKQPRLGNSLDSILVQYNGQPSSSADASWQTFNITSLVQQWRTNQRPNCGIGLTTEDSPIEIYCEDVIYSGDNQDSSKRPKLIITYTK